MASVLEGPRSSASPTASRALLRNDEGSTPPTSFVRPPPTKFAFTTRRECNERCVAPWRLCCWRCRARGCRPRAEPAPLRLSLHVECVEALVDRESVFAFPRIHSAFGEFLLQNAAEPAVYFQPIVIVVETNTRSDVSRAAELTMCVRNYFLFATRMTHFDMSRTLAEGLVSIFVGVWGVIIVLAVMYGLLAWSSGSAEGSVQNVVQVFLTTILTVLLWVFVWHPWEILVFGRILSRQQAHIFARMGTATVEVVFRVKAFPLLAPPSHEMLLLV